MNHGLLKEQVIKTTENHLEETLLGHLGITRELLAFQSADKKYHIGSEKGGSNLIKVLLLTTEKSVTGC